jgi:hypothetical protein
MSVFTIVPHVLLAFGKHEAGIALAIMGVVGIAIVLLCHVLRARGWRP